MQNISAQQALPPRVKSQEKDDYKIVSIRLRSPEFEAFDQQARALGLSSSMAVRIAVRKIGGFLETDKEIRREFENALRGIGAVSRALMTLHAAYETDAKVDMQAFASQRAAFGREFAVLDGMLRRLLNINQRRIDGRVMLQDAIPQ